MYIFTSSLLLHSQSWTAINKLPHLSNTTGIVSATSAHVFCTQGHPRGNILNEITTIRWPNPFPLDRIKNLATVRIRHQRNGFCSRCVVYFAEQWRHAL